MDGTSNIEDNKSTKVRNSEKDDSQKSRKFERKGGKNGFTFSKSPRNAVESMEKKENPVPSPGTYQSYS